MGECSLKGHTMSHSQKPPFSWGISNIRLKGTGDASEKTHRDSDSQGGGRQPWNLKSPPKCWDGRFARVSAVLGMQPGASHIRQALRGLHCLPSLLVDLQCVRGLGLGSPARRLCSPLFHTLLGLTEFRHPSSTAPSKALPGSFSSERSSAAASHSEERYPRLSEDSMAARLPAATGPTCLHKVSLMPGIHHRLLPPLLPSHVGLCRPSRSLPS